MIETTQINSEANAPMQPITPTDNQSDCASVPAEEDPPSWVAICLDDPHVARALGDRPVFFSITYLNRQSARELNYEYREKDYATNVLSFPAELPDFITCVEDGFTLGDLVISPDVVKREAITFGRPIEHHYIHLIIHGFLHLLGFDHIDTDEAAHMESIEIASLKKLGISNPYLENMPNDQVKTTGKQEKIPKKRPNSPNSSIPPINHTEIT